MFLDASTKMLRIALDGAVATNQVQVITNYTDQIQERVTPKVQTTVTAGATKTNIVSPPADNTLREVTEIYVYNRDTATRTIKIYMYDGTTDWEILETSLNTLRTLQYNSKTGWEVLL